MRPTTERLVVVDRELAKRQVEIRERRWAIFSTSLTLIGLLVEAGTHTSRDMAHLNPIADPITLALFLGMAIAPVVNVVVLDTNLGQNNVLRQAAIALTCLALPVAMANALGFLPVLPLFPIALLMGGVGLLLGIPYVALPVLLVQLRRLYQQQEPDSRAGRGPLRTIASLLALYGVAAAALALTQNWGCWPS